MFGNKLLDYLFSITNDDIRICELLELIKQDKDKTLEALNNGIPLFDFTRSDLIFEVAKVCAILDYKYPDCENLPEWVFNKNFYYKEAHYVGNHLSDFDKVKMFLFAPHAFRYRNIYFQEAGLERV